MSWEDGLKPDTVAGGEAEIFTALLRDALGNRHCTYAARLVRGERGRGKEKGRRREGEGGRREGREE